MLHKLTLILGFAAGFSTQLAQAGPPLICHPYDIDGAKSLPWGDPTHGGWENPDRAYDVRRLSSDTLALLNSDTAVMVRMETLRRAAIYGVQNPGAMEDLLEKLNTRLAASNALANFDYGFLLATLKQLDWKYKRDMTGGVDGYDYVKRALVIESNPEMHFAAALITSWSPVRPTERDEHFQRAKAARSDVLLARNVDAMFRQ